MQEKDKSGRLFTYRELLLILKKLCKEKHTGVMFINSNDNDLAQIVFQQGVIFDVTFKGESGKAALELIKQLKQGKATFSNPLEQQETIEKKISLSTLQIFQLLSADVQVIPQESPPQLKDQATLPMAQNVVSLNSDFNITEASSMVVIEAQLTIIIGPVAKIIFFEYSRAIIQVQNDFKALNKIVEKIAKDVLMVEQQKLFRQNLVAFINQYNLKNHDAILCALKSSDKKLRLRNSTLGLLINKYATQGRLNRVLINQLLLQIECAGNLGSCVNLLALLQILEQSDKTGLLEVREKNKVGGFYFDKGVLINAVECGMNGKIIAMDILQWDHDYLVFNAVPQSGVSRQILQTIDVLAKEVTLLKIEVNSDNNTSLVQCSDVDEIALLTTAIELAESCEGAQAEIILTDILIHNEDNFKAWLWLSRVLTNMTAIEITLKKAEYIHAKNADLIEETRKFTLAKKIISTEFVMRCPFCWIPTAKEDIQCHYCQSNFFIHANFFKNLGKANSLLLDSAIERYGYILQKKEVKNNAIYLRFYLAMAYLNRQYFQESLDQLNEIARLAPQNKALATQGAILTHYMNAKGLNFDKVTREIAIAEQQINSENEGLKAKILLVEDSLVTRKVIARTLIANGYEIFEAKNAFEAMSGIEQKNPDMILLDIVLPGKDGYEILEEIRQKPLFEKTPVIMLTSRDGLFDKLKGKVSTANEYLTKPFQPEELLTVVRKHLATPKNNDVTHDMNVVNHNSATIIQKSVDEAQQNYSENVLKAKILVVEDSIVTRKIIARTLVARGYEVFEAKNSFEALTEIEQRNPDLILLDIILPGKDGYEILEEIKQKPMFKNTPVVMLTSRDSLFDKLKGKISDANEYLTKPFQPNELLAVVRKYLRSS
jgi:twitching motility two-component system response regulator PilG